MVANMTNWRDVLGNCTLKLQWARHSPEELPTVFQDAHVEFIQEVRHAFRSFSVCLGLMAAAHGKRISELNYYYRVRKHHC